MLRSYDVLLISAMIGAAALTYQIKHRAEEKLDEVMRLEVEIRQQEDTIDLLKADWALLNQPARLETLTKAFSEELGLQTITPEQMAPAEELPGFPVKDPGSPAIAGEPAAADANIQTGSVRP